MEMGVHASLVVQANKTVPTNMNLLSDEELTELRSIVTKEVRDGLGLVNGVDVIVGTNDFRGISLLSLQA
jgi:hypothetical protein